MTSETSGAVPAWVAAVGRRIRFMRQHENWTVQQLADRADVSRRMLTQIELGQANPSLTTVDRIALALGTDFPGLAMASSAADGPSARIMQSTRIWEDVEASEAVLLGVTSSDPRSELWRWTLAPGRRYDSAPNADGTEAIIHVLSGTLTIRDEVNSIEVPAGETAVFRTDGAYSYVNDGEVSVHFVRLFRSL